MIHAIKTVTVGDVESTIDSPIVLYRGDREVEIQFTILEQSYTFNDDNNLIKSSNASHGQLVLNTPSGENMFSEVSKCYDGNVVFVVTKDMIDELQEVGFYSFQIRLYDSSQTSRITIPPVFNGFDIRNPIAAEDEGNIIDQALVDYSRVTKDLPNEELPVFDEQGNYNKTDWVHNDVITKNKMNKIENAIYSVNAIANANFKGDGEGTVDLSAYATKKYVDDSIDVIELTPGPKGDKGDQGEQGPKGDKGDKGDTPSLNGYATEAYVDNAMANAQLDNKHHIILDLLDKRKIMAHRNLCVDYPENTITGILECIRAGVKYFELDFRESADGELFMLHDYTTERTSSTNINITTSTSEEIKSIIQDKLVNPKKYKNIGINTLDEVIEVIKAHDCYFNINFDYGPSDSKKEEIISKIIDAGILNKVILSASKFEDYAHLGVCLSKQIPVTDEAFIEAAKQGNIIAGYDFGYGTTETYISDINNAMRLGAKYRVPILIWNTDDYTIFKNINRLTYVNLMMVDRLWKRRDD